MSKALIFTLCLCLLFAASTRAEEFDAAAEDMMAESDATSEVAKLARDRAQEERAEAAKARQEASRSKKAAEEKRREATKALGKAENEINRMRAEQNKANKAKMVAEKEVTRHEMAMAAMQARIEVLKTQLDATNQQIEAQTHKNANLEQRIKDAELQITRLESEVEEAKGDFREGQAREKEKQFKLNEAIKRAAEHRPVLMHQIADLRSRLKAAKDQTIKLGAEAEKRMHENSKLQEQIEFGGKHLKQVQERKARKTEAAQAARRQAAKIAKHNGDDME